MGREKELINKIRQLEMNLSDLRLELERSQKPNERLERIQIEVGQKVQILNPRPGQAQFGTVSKVNQETGWVTIGTVVYNKGVKLRQKVSRHSRNIERV